MSQLIEALKWRYATKKYDPDLKVDDAKLDRILEAIRLTATSSGLQPFEVIVITNPELRKKIRQVSWDQSQITDCSHLLVFAAWHDITPERVNMMFDLTNDIRGTSHPAWENYRQLLLTIVNQRGQENNYQAAARQAYIGLGSALIAAAMEQVDATPMEGFDPQAIDLILGLPERNLRSVVILPLGYRAKEGDWLVNLQKVRRPVEQFITRID
ncbi:nitroreductase [Tatumella morbirosei]|uniref:Nitroreductase n=1 Tax=Tatumella morbirosei TaxID=642227 RepID=A0A095T8E5_9GAMM|nr:NAD(P)H-dependent oxidoreductase [Tatumella morbirosei]KGD72987.1 nitroreductase [Tatumella morbirosei]